MALNIKINFEECYEIETLSNDLSLSKFNTILKTGEKVSLGVLISNTVHHYLPDVYNLAFGPLHNSNQIDDKAKLNHENHSKVFSTIIFTALTFLTENKEKYLGIDGSNNARAYMYYRCIQNNFDYLNQFFNIYGVNYYVRVLRKLKDEDDSHPVDGDDVKVVPQIIERNRIVPPEKLYNYFIFNLKQAF
ncbi:MAG: hypothetical protein WDO19_16315 [Bacteroidota bacterium]